MKTKILYLSDDSDIKEDFSELAQKLSQGHIFKFTFTFRAQLKANEIYLAICIASHACHDHYAIDGELLNFLNRRQNINGYSIELPIEVLGGGYVKKENDKLIFYKDSFKYGKYRKDFL